MYDIIVYNYINLVFWYVCMHMISSFINYINLVPCGMYVLDIIVYNYIKIWCSIWSVCMHMISSFINYINLVPSGMYVYDIIVYNYINLVFHLVYVYDIIAYNINCTKKKKKITYTVYIYDLYDGWWQYECVIIIIEC